MKTRTSKLFDYESVFMGLNAESATDLDNLVRRDIRLQRLFAALPAQNGKLLDVGSGGGTITAAIALHYPKAKVLGCDISRRAISLAQKNYRKIASFSVIQNGRFPYPDNSFDTVVFFDVLEHVPDTGQFLGQVHRVLKKEGFLFCAIPCEGQPGSLTWFLQKIHLGDKLTYKHIGHIHPEFTHFYIRKLFSKEKFRILKVTYSEHFITQCIRFIRFIVPKETLELFLGSRRAEQYYDRSILAASGSRVKNIFTIIRDIWLWMAGPFEFIEHLEATLGKHSEFTAWKMLILARKIQD